ncbi:N-acetyltransferase NAT13 [Fomitiporia mediterranea MF3/22]|uniref:N-acetyltransferase NAT13 n=1 Tax=Fomitiporia mediterranea (strain MF3/22) TaxID=694068 RepID=UPI0004409083|nr:N-acetyltransferase NAT13 [Fomitiporia mediterranea MF3/22]EJD03122.1 N-acetyltransferase NAT13 [Fomitiporia mediterranea MF3/22]
MSTTTVTTVRPPVDRVSFSSLTNNNLGTARVLNSTLFPVKYSEKFYKGIVQPEVEDFCKLIYYNDIPVGTVCCRFEEINNETRLYLMTMGVLAPYRSRKIGSKALQHVLDAAKASEKPKISTVYLHVQCSNEDAKQFYERHGFTEAGLAVDYYKKIEPRDAWILEYKLHTIAAQSEDKPVEGQDVSPSPAA